MPYRTTSRPVFAIMLLIGAMVLPSAGTVLCIGPDGHAAIEPVHPVSGCDNVDGRTTGAGEHLAGISTPGGCVDFPLAAVDWMPRPEREQKRFDASSFDLLTPIYLIDPATDADATSTPIQLARWVDHAGVAGLRPSLRSTVLLL